MKRPPHRCRYFRKALPGRDRRCSVCPECRREHGPGPLAVWDGTRQSPRDHARRLPEDVDGAWDDAVRAYEEGRGEAA